MRLVTGKSKRGLGLAYFLVGSFSIIYNIKGITGFTILNSIKSASFVGGLILIVGGILLTVFGKENRLEISLYEQKGKEGDERFYMTDPESLFSEKGAVSLEEFRKRMRDIKKDPELFQMIKEVYFSPLVKRLNEKGRMSPIAKMYLAEMDFSDEEDSMREERYALPSKEITRIKNAFRESGNTTLSSAQRAVLRDYGLIYTKGRKHAKITPQEGGEGMSLAVSSSDVRAGKNNTSIILKMCDRQYRKRTIH